MASFDSPRVHLSAPVIICLFLIGSSMSIPFSILKNIELRQIKMCQVDSSCNNCSLQIERELLLEQGKLLQNQLKKTDQGLFTSNGESVEDQLCAIPKFRDQQQYCCEMWTAFDCRSRIATEKCTFLNYVKFRKNLVQWANDLMLLNVCVDFDYGSKECQQHQQETRFEQIAQRRQNE